MKVALAQLEIELAAVAKNRAKVVDCAAQAAAAGADVLVLPETWNLGFFPQENLSDLAEPEGGESKNLLAALAAKHKMNIVGGSIITKKGGDVYNTAYVFDRQGNQLAEYDKIHGFSPSGEHLHFKHGQELCLFEL
ncbi:MAG: carbon-nitrogen family hydrolase, partial [Sporomusaceae bacterium]|nr:carbon-nitrogen family hydrolase [Sporomusaceae bacterium]